MIRWTPAIRPHAGCPHNRLSRMLAAEMPDGAAVGASTQRAWASANFVGARHIFACTGVRSAPALQQKLADAEWVLLGHIVADATVEPAGDDGQVRIEILTVED